MEESRQPLIYIIENSPSKFLCDLGKATRRGIKKCPKCGTYNGTRGFMCKNKLCDVVFKDCADNNKRKVSLDAVCLIGIVRRVYSVRVKDRGPDQRGFVQLPLLLHQEDQDRLSETALCFVDSCQRLFDNSILNCHEHELDQIAKNLSCVHIDSAIKSQHAAIPIQFKKEILDSLNVSKEIKDKLWVLATEKEGPLVQRVSKTVMAVKCQVSPKHPLGYLHFTFGCTKGKETYDKFYCSCSDFIGFFHKSNNNNIRLKCVHYYACVCALASDSKYSQEFIFFIESEFSKRFLNLLIQPNGKNIKSTENINSAFKRRVFNKTTIAKPFINNKGNHKKNKTLVANILPVKIQLIQKNATIPKKCTSPCWNFIEWLTYVTESINRTMRFENYGSLILLVFSVPEVFFEEFEKRIPAEYKRAEGPSVYRIMNILHVKEIFDTPDVKLKISKRFIHDYHQGYVEYADNDNASSSTGLINSNFIFFLNVGQSTVDESENTNNAFLIEWSPPPEDGSFISRVGHLKLKYKYGRKTIA